MTKATLSLDAKLENRVWSRPKTSLGTLTLAILKKISTHNLEK
jgi:hypothetical protein